MGLGQLIIDFTALQEVFEQQTIAFGYGLRPGAAPESRMYQELPATASQLALLLETHTDSHNIRFDTHLNLGKDGAACACIAQ